MTFVARLFLSVARVAARTYVALDRQPASRVRHFAEPERVRPTSPLWILHAR
jgi:hypothetical protein